LQPELHFVTADFSRFYLVQDLITRDATRQTTDLHNKAFHYLILSRNRHITSELFAGFNEFRNKESL